MATIRDVRGALNSQWTDAEFNDLQRRIGARRRAADRTRRTVIVLGSLAASVALFLVAKTAWRTEISVRPAAPPAAPIMESGRAIRLADGSLATPLTDDTRLVVGGSGTEVTIVHIEHGAARFTVAKQHARTFRVVAGPIFVDVRGTEFTVVPEAGAHRVSVSEGRVQVRWGDAHVAELAAGASGIYPPPPDGSGSGKGGVTATGRAGAGPRAVASSRGSASGKPAAWRDLAKQGAYGPAYEVLEHSSADPVRDDPADLLLSADVARLSGHPERAVPPLATILRRHAADPRAPLAAFTLGRVLRDHLARPRQAAEAFARAQKLAPHGQLSEDALAREAEAWSAAGESSRARDLAGIYLQRYPAGLRHRSMRSLLGSR